MNKIYFLKHFQNGSWKVCFQNLGLVLIVVVFILDL